VAFISQHHGSWVDPTLCWKIVPGGRCVLGARHSGACAPVVNPEAWERLCKMIGWKEPFDAMIEEEG
jgi:hypothetical protein